MPPNAMVARDEEQEDRMASEPSLWLPRTVIRRHRKTATVIWVILVVVFLAYVSYVVWDAVDSRRDPAASFQLKQEVYTLPDVAVCLTQNVGCLASNTSFCLQTAAFSMLFQYGFLDETLEVDDASLAIEEVYYSCKVLPASKLQVNQTGVDNGDITHLSATFAFFWSEDPLSEYDPTDENFGSLNTQFANLYFLNVDDGVEAIGEEIIDARLPYERVTATNGETMVTSTTHLMMDLTEFEPISTSSGKKGKTERTFTQSSTSAKVNVYWQNEDIDFEVAWLTFELLIPKFEYTIIKEVDPVDAWAIVGAIGGVWQFVVIGFGMFFVFAEKQAPDKKMRNFRKTLAKPAIATRRFSSLSSRGSATQATEDIAVDASDEDLPVEWIKRQRKDGSFYYCNTMTGAVQNRSPLEGIGDGDATTATPAAAAPAAPRPPHGIARVFQGGYRPESSGNSLPPGWRERTDGAGKTYYENTVLKTTQWKRPKQRAPTTGGSSVQAVDAPVAHSRRGSGSPVHSASSVGNSSQNGGGSNVGSAGGPAPPYRPTYTAPSPPAPDGRAPSSSVSKVPSYRTMMSLPSSSGGAPDTKPSNAAAAGFATTTSGGDGGGGAGSMSLPPGWERRTTPNGETYYANTTTKVTQWNAPPM
eukprot:g10275.t1